MPPPPPAVRHNLKYLLGALAGVSLAVLGAAWSAMDRAAVSELAGLAGGESLGVSDAIRTAGSETAASELVGADAAGIAADVATATASSETAATPDGTIRIGESKGHAIVVTAGDDSTVTVRIGVPEEPEKPEGATAAVSVAPSGDDGSGEPGIPMAAGPDLESVANPMAPLMEHEGYSGEPYELDGKAHVCYGHNLSASGGDLTERSLRECVDLIYKDMLAATHAAIDAVGEETWLKLSPVRQGVISELAFMVGADGVREFKRFIRAVQKEEFDLAAIELENSRMAEQIAPDRLADMMGRIGH